MKVGDLVKRIVWEADGGYEVPGSVGLVIDMLVEPTPAQTSHRQWAVLWTYDGIPKFRMEDGTSVMFEDELEVISLT
tara:strand:- start:341 stop:571 length:231 start_codon:yes stop_codon:yes gene_type:complete